MADENLHAKHRARMQERVERDGLDSQIGRAHV